ncbi:hypothetical protein C467_02586 [Halorubrum hochstenium ATCC 700873]|uniref:Uncharacterized protein n=1 Tax=Halorubrum hochstenium ATCC 700873 TaxID=1227481 RepID=M0FKS7_9EURY|nr:hypothetical protein C467_02586 [Halorubrum hochstenium ATCC 700873]
MSGPTDSTDSTVAVVSIHWIGGRDTNPFPSASVLPVPKPIRPTDPRPTHPRPITGVMCSTFVENRSDAKGRS